MVVLSLGLLLAVIAVWAGLVAQTQETVYLVFLREKANLLSVKGNRTEVKRLLMQTAQRTQRPILARLQQWQQEGKVHQYRSLWIVNAISVKADSEVIEALKRDPSVLRVEKVRPVRLIQPIRRQRGIRPQQAFTWGLEKIRVPEVWNTFGVRGANVTVGVIDTGIDPTHPDLAGKLRPVNGWFDPYDPGSLPSDWHGHGTHVSGTIAGGNASGIHIGVAPGVTLIVARLFDEDEGATEEGMFACMQWMLDPDGDPSTDDGADVVNNSWGYIGSHSPDMDPSLRDALNAWIAANIFPAFSIGNDGPAPQTTNSPGDYPMAFGVGATDINDNIADFSSRGPVFWTGIGEIIKPDVSAPGDFVLSSVPGGGYEYWSGTSMACPHVVGTVALIQSFARAQGTELTVENIKNLLKNSAVDLGAPGPDNDYGWGRIDAFLSILPLAPDQNEPNDTPVQATFIAFGETLFGKIEPDEDIDLFKFSATQNTVITVKIQAEALGSGIDAVLQILDSDGSTVLAESDDYNGSKDPFIPKFVLPNSGDFYLKVTSKAFDNKMRHYTITLKLRSVPNLIATYNSDDNTVTLQWGSVFNNNRFRRLASRQPLIRPLDLQGYRVYRATQIQGPYDLIASLPSDQTSYVDSNLPPNQLVLFYRVTVVYDEGESDPATVRVLADPTEPNDDPSTATPITYGESKQGTILVPGDVDFYKFDGQKDDLVTIRVRALSLGYPMDPVVTLYNSDGQTRLVVDWYADWDYWWYEWWESPVLRFPLPHDGTFYIKVEDYLGSGSENHFYTITLVKDSPDDHGDWTQTATPIAYGQNISGTINPPPDTDYFAFYAEQGDFIIAEVFAQRQGSPLDSMLALYDEQGNIIAFNDDYYGLDSYISYQITQSGRYFLRVIPYGGSNVGGPDFTYTLSLRKTLAEQEPNDTPAQATQIAYGDTILGEINPPDDLDFYKFSGQLGDYVAISVEAFDPWWQNPALTLYDSDGQIVLAYNDNFPDWLWWSNNPRIVRFPLPHDGDFYVKVEDVWGVTGNYMLTIVKDAPDDHSDWPQNATTIASGQTVDGVIDPQFDSDYFVFDSPAGYFATAEVIAQRQGSPLIAILALYDEQGQQLAWSQGWWGWDPYIDIQLPRTGRYYLRVMPSDWGSLGGPDCTYKIVLTLQPGPQISVTPIFVEQTLLQGTKVTTAMNVSNVGGRSLTFIARGATSALSTLRHQPVNRRVMVVPENSKLYQEYLRAKQKREQKALSFQNMTLRPSQGITDSKKQQEWQQVIQRLMSKPTPHSKRLAQLFQNAVKTPPPSQPVSRPIKQTKIAPFQFVPNSETDQSIELIPLKNGKPITTLQNGQPPTGTWRWIMVDPDEFNGNARNIRKVFFQSDGTYLYFRAELEGGEFNPDDTYLDIFLDTDRNAATGVGWRSGMGVDYILFGGMGTIGVYRYNPSTGNFDYAADFVWFKSVNGAVEVGVKLSDIGNPVDFHVACEFWDSSAGAFDAVPDIWYAPVIRGVPWLDHSPLAGSLLGGEGVDLALTLDATSLGLGNHKANLVFNSNDVEKPQVVTPITLTVTQVPNVPELLTPADEAIVRPQVTFTVKVSDPDGDKVKAVIEVKKGNMTATYETDFVDSGTDVSVTVDKPLESGQWTHGERRR